MIQLTIEQTLQVALNHHRAGQLQQAESLYRQILAQQPNHADALHYLGVAAIQNGQNQTAIELIGKAIPLNPNRHDYHSNLGEAFRAAGQLDQAIAAFRTAIQLKPDYADAYYNLGNALRDQGELDQAIDAFRTAIQLQPTFVKALNNLGNVLGFKGLSDQSIDIFRTIIRLEPGNAEAHSNLGSALKDQGRLDQAISAFRTALQLKPGFAVAHSNLILTMLYHPACDAGSIAGETRRWNRMHGEPLKQFIVPHDNDRTPERRLRIGYVSPDFRMHPVGRFMLPLLAAHDHQCFEVFAYDQSPLRDDLTQQLSSHVDHWRRAAGLSDERMAELIRADRIDILVDLSGHTALSRLLLFARKPAPVQVAYLGFPGTTGLETMDYRLTDAFADPPGKTEAFHSEKLIRLPSTAWCFLPSSSPALVERRDRPITFGCCNTFAKVTEPMLKLWGRIARDVPGPRILLKSAALGNESVCRRVKELLGKEGISPERLELQGFKKAYADHLAYYGKIDIALDTFPYNGTTITCESLWMGVPVVSLAGPSHASRVGLSLLSNMGLPELAAQSESEYVRIAVDLARDFPRLQQLRSTLRERMQQSPLMDAPRFARVVESAYREMWRKWCEEAPAGRQS